MGIQENYKRSKGKNIKRANAYMQLKNGYLMSDNQVYVHYQSSNFKPKTKVAEIDRLIKSAYVDAAKSVRATQSKYLGKTEEEAADIIDQIKEVVSGSISTKKSSTMSSQIRDNLGDISFSQLSNVAKKAEDDIVFNGSQLAKFNEELKNIIDQMATITPEQMLEVSKAAEESLKSKKIPPNLPGGIFQYTKGNKDSYWYDKQLKQYRSQFAFIEGSKKANTALLRLITAYKRLEDIQIRAVGPLTVNESKEINHIISKLGGLVNTLGTSGIELVIANAIQVGALTANETISDFFKSIGGSEGASIEVSPAGEDTGGLNKDDMSGFLRENSQYISNPERSFVNKSDVNISFKKLGENGGELVINIGLNIKDYKENQKGEINPTFLGKGNYKDYLIRSEVFRTEMEYDLINSIAQKYSKAQLKKDKKGSLIRTKSGTASYDKKTLNEGNYIAIKNLMAAKSALTAIVGLQNREDASYLVVFSNKVITTYDLFTKMAGQERMRLELEILNEDVIAPFVTEFFQTPADEIQDAYTRSRNILEASYANFKVSVHGRNMKI